MPGQVLHRFAVEPNPGYLYWVVLQDEQMDAVCCGERRVVEGRRHRRLSGLECSWWYFNDVDLSLLRVEVGADAENTSTVWEGRVYDAYRGSLCSVLLL